MAAAEAELNFSDEDDVDAYDDAAQRLVTGMALLAADLGEWLARPAAEVIADGLSVVIAGPPNAGKSSLIHALVQRELAIVSPVAGTTRDVIETSLALAVIAMRLSDPAGRRADGAAPTWGIGRWE